MKEREHRFAFIPHLKEVGIPACGRKHIVGIGPVGGLFESHHIGRKIDRAFPRQGAMSHYLNNHFATEEISSKNVCLLNVGRHGLPVNDVALCGGEGDAYFGDGAAI